MLKIETARVAALVNFPSIMESTPATHPQHWELVWSDEFDYEGLPDPAKWGYEEGFVRNEELQYYTRGRKENARVENGVLVLECRKEIFKNPRFDPKAKMWKRSREFAQYTSASLNTIHAGSWQYGRIEIRAKLPQGKGIWPAFWAMGVNYEEVSWPRCGEIDIMEYVGADPQHVHATVHYGGAEGHLSKGDKLNVERPNDDFHVFTSVWTSDKIDFYFDGQKFHSFVLDEAGKGEENPFRQPHYLLLNLALGGGWGGPVDEAILPQKYLVDYVRVYQRVPEVGEASS